MKKERDTFGDRIAASFLMLLASFITALIIWAFISFLTFKSSSEAFIPFSYVMYTSLSFAVFAFMAPNKSLDAIGWVWKQMENLFRFN